MDGFLRYRFGGLIHGGAYFRKLFYGIHVIKRTHVYIFKMRPRLYLSEVTAV